MRREFNEIGHITPGTACLMVVVFLAYLFCQVSKTVLHLSNRVMLYYLIGFGTVYIGGYSIILIQKPGWLETLDIIAKYCMLLLAIILAPFSLLPDRPILAGLIGAAGAILIALLLYRNSHNMIKGAENNREITQKL